MPGYGRGAVRSPTSVEPAASEIIGYDDVGDSVEDELHILCVRGTGLVAVDLFVLRLVLALELHLDVGRRLLVVHGP